MSRNKDERTPDFQELARECDALPKVQNVQNGADTSSAEPQQLDMDDADDEKSLDNGNGLGDVPPAINRAKNVRLIIATNNQGDQNDERVEENRNDERVAQPPNLKKTDEKIIATLMANGCKGDAWLQAKERIKEIAEKLNSSKGHWAQDNEGRNWFHAGILEVDQYIDACKVYYSLAEHKETDMHDSFITKCNNQLQDITRSQDDFRSIAEDLWNNNSPQQGWIDYFYELIVNACRYVTFNKETYQTNQHKAVEITSIVNNIALSNRAKE